MTTKWYPFLVNNDNCLLKKESNLGFVVCKQDITFKRNFASFEDHIKFWRYINSIEKKDWHFFEIVLNKNNRIKAYFDLDFKTKLENAEERILKFKSFLEEKTSGGKVNIFSSFSKSILTSAGDRIDFEKEKTSFHIVITEAHLSSIMEAEFFAKYIKESYLSIDEELSEGIDLCVYKANQQFRICYSCKAGTSRVKLPFLFDIDDKKVCYDFTTFEDSLLTYLGSSSKKLKYEKEEEFTSFCVSVKKQVFLTETQNEEEENLNEQDLIIIKKIEEHLEDDFSVRDVKKTFCVCSGTEQTQKDNDSDFSLLISLNRLKPSFCEVCQKIHDSENPYLLYFSENDKVLFNCRRNEKFSEITIFFTSSFLGSPKDEPKTDILKVITSTRKIKKGLKISSFL